MPALLDIPGIEDATAFHLNRWEEVCADPSLHGIEGRVETNRFGQIVMTPPPGFTHATRQSEICLRLKTMLQGGHAVTECAVLTSDGVKGVDVAWISERRVMQGLKGEILTIAPEICVEVFPPGNTRQQMEAKRLLYLEAGAEEVWLCDRKGALHFFLKSSGETETGSSVLRAKMPGTVKAQALIAWMNGFEMRGRGAYGIHHDFDGAVKNVCCKSRIKSRAEKPLILYLLYPLPCSNSSIRSLRMSLGFAKDSRSTNSMNSGTPENAVAAAIRSSGGRKELRTEVIVTTGRPPRSPGVSTFSS